MCCDSQGEKCSKKVVSTVECRVHEAILSAMDNLVCAGMELSMRLVGISPAIPVMSFWSLIREIYRMTRRV